jgi:hypothetical protein
MARRLLLLKRNQLIPCSFVLKDFAGISFGYRFFFCAVPAEIRIQLLAKSEERNCGNISQDFMGQVGNLPMGSSSGKVKILRAGRNPGSFAKAMV